MHNNMNVNVSGPVSAPATYKTVVLKPNMVDGVNLLTQEMVNSVNTKYIIKHDFVLTKDVVEDSVNVLSTNISQCVNPAYANALAAYNEAHDAWIDADNAYTNDPNETTLAAKNAAYAVYNAAQTTLNNTPQYYFYASKSISIKKHNHIELSEGAVLLNSTLNGTIEFDVASSDMTVYIGSIIPGTYNYTVNNAIVIPSGCLIEFDGGSISDGTVIGNNTILIFKQSIDDVMKNVQLDGAFSYSIAEDKPAGDGMGRVILTKGKGFAEQLVKGNTIYIIQYDFDLNGESATIPANCMLEFEGGSLRNGTLTGNDTKIIAAKEKIFNNIVIGGTWNIPIIQSIWFENIYENNVIKQLINLTDSTTENTVIIEEGTYNVSVDSNNKEVINLNSNTNLVINGAINLLSTDLREYHIISIKSAENVCISGSGSIVGDRNTHTGEGGEWGHGIIVSCSNNIQISGITVSYCWGDSIYIGMDDNIGIPSTNIYIHDVELHHSRRQGISVTAGHNVTIERCIIHDINGTWPQAAIDFEPNENVIGNRNAIVSNCIIYDCIRGIDSNGGDNANKNISIINNTIEAIQWGLAINMSNGIISNNIIKAPTVFRFRTYFSDLSIENNHCEVVEAEGYTDLGIVRLVNPFDNIGANIKITGNYFDAHSGYVFVVCSGMIIANNTCKGNYFYRTASTLADIKCIIEKNEIQVTNMNIRANLILLNNHITADSFIVEHSFIAKNNRITCQTTIASNFELELYNNNIEVVAAANDISLTRTSKIVGNTLKRISVSIAESDTNKILIIKNNTFSNNAEYAVGCVQIIKSNIRIIITDNIVDNRTIGENLIPFSTFLDVYGTSSKNNECCRNIINGNHLYFFKYNDTASVGSFTISENMLPSGDTLEVTSNARPSLNFAVDKNKDIKGSTSNRPTLSATYVGFQYYDMTLNKPIWWNGSAWIDATGATV